MDFNTGIPVSPHIGMLELLKNRCVPLLGGLDLLWKKKELELTETEMEQIPETEDTEMQPSETFGDRVEDENNINNDTQEEEEGASKSAKRRVTRSGHLKGNTSDAVPSNVGNTHNDTNRYRMKKNCRRRKLPSKICAGNARACGLGNGRRSV